MDNRLIVHEVHFRGLLMSSQTRRFQRPLTLLIVFGLVCEPALVHAGSWSYAPVKSAASTLDPATGQPTVLYGNAQPGVNQYHPTLYVPPAVAAVTPSPTPAGSQNQMMLTMAGAMLPALMGMMSGKKDSSSTAPLASGTQTPAAAPAAAPAVAPAASGAANARPSADTPESSGEVVLASRTPGGTLAPDNSAPSRAGSCSQSDFAPPMPNIRATSCFASSRDGGARLHKGLDLNTTKDSTGRSFGRGQPGAVIQAVANGKIRTAAKMGGRSGPTIIMDHRNCPARSGGGSVGSNCASIYRHMGSRFAVRPGQCYDVGTKLGVVGRQSENGGVTPHLHIEIVTGSRAYNPAAFASIIPQGSSLGSCNRNMNTLAHGSVRRHLSPRRTGSTR